MRDAWRLSTSNRPERLAEGRAQPTVRIFCRELMADPFGPGGCVTSYHCMPQTLAETMPSPRAERQVIRRASVLGVEYENLEVQFAQQDRVEPESLELYARIANQQRRLLESVGMKRVARDVTPTLQTYLHHKNGANGEVVSQ